MQEDEEIIVEREKPDVDGASEEELEATESRVDAKLSKLKKELEACKKEKHEYLDGWQRAKADYVNALKRFELDRKQAMDQGALKAAQAFLPAIDSLARAEAAGEVPDAVKNIAKQLHDGARTIGLTRFGNVGDSFDPAVHDALGQDVTDDEKLDDTVSTMLEEGWKLHDTVVRPAKVRVAQWEA